MATITIIYADRIHKILCFLQEVKELLQGTNQTPYNAFKHSKKFGISNDIFYTFFRAKWITGETKNNKTVYTWVGNDITRENIQTVLALEKTRVKGPSKASSTRSDVKNRATVGYNFTRSRKKKAKAQNTDANVRPAILPKESWPQIPGVTSPTPPPDIILESVVEPIIEAIVEPIVEIITEPPTPLPVKQADDAPLPIYELLRQMRLRGVKGKFTVPVITYEEFEL